MLANHCPPSKTHHHILNVLLYQVALRGHQNGAAKGVQVGKVQLVWHTVDGVGRVHMDIP